MDKNARAEINFLKIFDLTAYVLRDILLGGQKVMVMMTTHYLYMEDVKKNA